MILEDGCKFIGWFNNEQRVFGTKIYPNGATFTGPYKDNVRHGVGVKKHADGTQTLVSYNAGERV